MTDRTEYQHPTFQPYSNGTWMEVGFSWMIAVTVIAALLLTL